MNSKVYAIIVLFAVVFAKIAPAQDQSAWSPYLDMNHFLQPFWNSDTIYAEAVMPVSRNGKTAEGRLLFKAKKILTIKDTHLQKEYKKGRDWKYKDGKVVLTKNTNIPFFTGDELLFSEKKEGISLPAKKEGQFVLFSEQGLLQSRQLAVTYIKEKSSTWQGPKPAYASQLLPATAAKLRAGEPLKIVFYGNSIETGANSSITLNQAPFLPTWPEMIIYNLKHHYTDAITFKNVSRGGMAAKWGLENTATLVNTEKPDLVIIGFGMNDGTAKVPAPTFIDQIKGIIQTAKSANPSCEFIVIATMLANPDAIHSQLQPSYLAPLTALQDQGIAIADMTSIHDELLRHKAYQDMTGNNINHPNDYLARWYAQVIGALLIP